MDKDSSRLTDELLGWVKLFGPLLVWDFPSIGVWVELLQDPYGIGIVDETFGLLLESERGSPLGILLDYDTCPPVGL